MQLAHLAPHQRDQQHHVQGHQRHERQLLHAKRRRTARGVTHQVAAHLHEVGDGAVEREDEHRVDAAIARDLAAMHHHEHARQHEARIRHAASHRGELASRERQHDEARRRDGKQHAEHAHKVHVDGAPPPCPVKHGHHGQQREHREDVDGAEQLLVRDRDEADGARAEPERAHRQRRQEAFAQCVLVHHRVLARHVVEHGLLRVRRVRGDPQAQPRQRHQHQGYKVGGERRGDEAQEEVEQRREPGALDERKVAARAVERGEHALPAHEVARRPHADERRRAHHQRQRKRFQVHGSHQHERSERERHRKRQHVRTARKTGPRPCEGHGRAERQPERGDLHRVEYDGGERRLAERGQIGVDAAPDGRCVDGQKRRVPEAWHVRFQC